MDRATFDRIRQKHGAFASWAVWAEPTRQPKSNLGDLRILDPDKNPTLLRTIREDVVMVGLNLSRPCSEPLRNFHDPSPQAQDYKIRHAFAGTSFYGAYMTDIIKGIVMLKSSDLMRHLASTPSIVGENIHRLVEEFDDLGCAAPTVLAFGADAFKLAARHLPADRRSRLIRVTHYSHFLSKEDYRPRVLSEVAA